MRQSDPKDRLILVRVSREEKAALRALARHHGITLSQLMRDGAMAVAA